MRRARAGPLKFLYGLLPPSAPGAKHLGALSVAAARHVSCGAHTVRPCNLALTQRPLALRLHAKAVANYPSRSVYEPPLLCDNDVKQRPQPVTRPAVPRKESR